MFPRIRLDLDLQQGRLALVVELGPVLDTTGEPVPPRRPSLPPTAAASNVVPFPFRQAVGQ